MSAVIASDFVDLPPAQHADGVIRLPGSKSISLRALLLAALAEGTTRLEGVLESEDTQVMFDALEKLGIRCRKEGSPAEGSRNEGAADIAGGTWKIEGCNGRLRAARAEIDVGMSGVSTRLLVAALAIAGGDFRIDGAPRMRERPIKDLVDALVSVGANVTYDGDQGYPPLRIGKGALHLEAPIPIRGDVSSQFLTGLLQALPLAGKAAVVDIVGDLISKPYVDITIALMDRFGVSVERDGWRQFRIGEGAHYRSPGSLRIEGDASGASYFLAAGAIGASNGRRVRVNGVGRDSIQGDVAFADALERMGAVVEWGEHWIEAGHDRSLRGIDIDCTAIPDAAMTLAVVALFAEGATMLRGIGSWRVKETDRIAAMAAELVKVGAIVEAGSDYLRIERPLRFMPATIDTYNDHRMAMCFSLASLSGVPIRINDPACVRKTYPDYFADFRSVVR